MLPPSSLKLVEVTRIRFTQSTVSEFFGHGKHRGLLVQDVADCPRRQSAYNQPSLTKSSGRKMEASSYAWLAGSRCLSEVCSAKWKPRDGLPSFAGCLMNPLCEDCGVPFGFHISSSHSGTDPCKIIDPLKGVSSKHYLMRAVGFSGTLQALRPGMATSH